MDNNDLIYLVNTFGDNNEKVKELKKILDEKNAEIKSLMAAQELRSFSTDSYNASYIVKETVKLDEEKLLQVLIQDWAARNGSMECPYIKTKQYVDNDALEAAIYRGELDPNTLAKIKECSVVTQTPTLTVKKKGKK